MVRRSTFDPFSDDQRRWPHRVYVTNQFSKTMSERKIPAGADLRAEFYTELVRMAREGWTLEEPFKGSCFIRRGIERWYVTISQDSGA
jgi:hypothetical protein